MTEKDLYMGPNFKPEPTTPLSEGYTVKQQTLGFGTEINFKNRPPSGLPLEVWAQLGLESAKEALEQS